MKSQFLEQEITYDGTQLRSHWIYETAGVKEDAIVAFIGPCQVDLTHMVDLEDVVAKKHIYSLSMLHFISEQFDSDLEKMILRQRLFVSLMQAELVESQPDEKFVRKGDDLFLEHYKLSVSIATASPISTLLHVGINISSRDTPVPTKGLEDFGLNPVAFAWSVMNRYVDELRGVHWARCKVRGVS